MNLNICSNSIEGKPNYESLNRLFAPISDLLVFWLVSFAAAIAIDTQRVYGRDQDTAKLERFMQTSKTNTASMQIFREGRDLIEAQNWQRAAEKFNEFINGYPKDKDLDAALYWYGYALQTAREKRRSGSSASATDEPVSQFELAPGCAGVARRTGPQGLSRTALRRDNCEIKILALQSLFQADEERAIGIVTESLARIRTTCPGFQSAAVSIARRAWRRTRGADPARYRTQQCRPQTSSHRYQTFGRSDTTNKSPTS